MTLFLSWLLCLDRLTISNENPVSNPILLRMTALFMKKAYKPSVSSFQLLYSVHYIGVFNDCLLRLTVMFSMMVYFWALLYLHWLTISNENPVSNPILLRMTALFMKKSYKLSVSSFQLLYSVN